MIPSDLPAPPLPEERKAPQLRLLPAPRIPRGPVNGDGWALEWAAVANLGSWLLATNQLSRIADSDTKALLLLMRTPGNYTHLYNLYRASGEWVAP